MTGSNFLLDSNIILYLLAGDKTLFSLLEEKQLYISFVSQLEILSYKGLSSNEIKNIRSFFNECVIIDINPVIKDYTIKIRKEYSLKLPDSIIAATSIYLNSALLTADTDFKKVKDLDLFLFE